MQHTVYIINLPHRKDRLESVIKQFDNKPEFNLHFVSPENDLNPRRSLWRTLCKLVEFEFSNSNNRYFIYCEDDHIFTDDYSAERLEQAINNADDMGADILLGGVSWQHLPLQINDYLFYLTSFTGLQFTIIFRSFFNTILEAEFSDNNVADILISSLTNNKFLTFPTISIQQEFGYSDVTPMNSAQGRVEFLFKATQNILERHHQVRKYYFAKNSEIPHRNIIPEDIIIPAYIINLTNRPERLKHCLFQFSGKEEFEVTTIKACKDKNGRLGLWHSIVKCVQKAVENDEDFFLLCEDDHVFTPNYDKDIFVRNIVDAYVQRADLLIGGIGGSGMCIPITLERYWVDWFWCTQFIIIYKHFYEKILSYEFNDHDTADGALSKLSVNKMVLYPFISTQHDFGYSDVTETNNTKGRIQNYFKLEEKKFDSVDAINKRFLS